MRRPYRFGHVQPLFDYHESGCDPQSVQSRVYDTTGALAVRRAKSWMKLAEPKEAPLKKPDKDMFDPKNFLAKVGTGKQVLEFHKNQHVSEQGKEAVVGIVGPGQFLVKAA